MTKAAQGLWLASIGLSIAVGAFIWRAAAASAHEESARAVAGYRTQRTGRYFGPEPFNNGPYFLAGAVACLLIVCGVILYASSSDDSVSSSTGR